MDYTSDYDRSMGRTIITLNKGELATEMEVREDHLSIVKSCHGGVIAGMMDALLGTTALTLVKEKGWFVSTIEFKINYYKPVALNQTLVGTGEVDFEGKNIIATIGAIRIKDTDEIAARGLGTFKIFRPK